MVSILFTEGGFVLEQETCVKQIQLRERRKRLQPPVQVVPPATTAQFMELPKRPGGIRAFFAPEQLLRNLALVGCLSLVVLAVQRMGEGQRSISVFSALEDQLTAAWEEDIGKLSFVSELLPPEIREVWNPGSAISVVAPVVGDTVHAWSVQEPYLEIASSVTDVRAAAPGEVMSIAHGLGEERILRLRHPDDTETLYGNLKDCLAQVGDTVESGEVIATLLPGKPLAFELRVDGRPVDPSAGMLQPEE